MDFDILTQPLGSPEKISETEQPRIPVGTLIRQSYKGIPQVYYPISTGENVIGRSLGECHVHLPMKAVSSRHAIIDVKGENHLLWDLRSRNRTFRAKHPLIPEVRYELRDGDMLRFGDVDCKYVKEVLQRDSGSESEPELTVATANTSVTHERSGTSTEAVVPTVSNRPASPDPQPLPVIPFSPISPTPSTSKDPFNLPRPSGEAVATTSADPTATTSADPTATTSADPTATTSADPTATTSADPTATTSADPTATTSADVTATSGDVTTTSGDVTTTSGDVTTTSGDVTATTTSGDVNSTTTSGDVTGGAELTGGTTTFLFKDTSLRVLQSDSENDEDSVDFIDTSVSNVAAIDQRSDSTADKSVDFAAESDAVISVNESLLPTLISDSDTDIEDESSAKTPPTEKPNQEEEKVDELVQGKNDPGDTLIGPVDISDIATQPYDNCDRDDDDGDRSGVVGTPDLFDAPTQLYDQILDFGNVANMPAPPQPSIEQDFTASTDSSPAAAKEDVEEVATETKRDDSDKETVEAEPSTDPDKSSCSKKRYVSEICFLEAPTQLYDPKEDLEEYKPSCSGEFVPSRIERKEDSDSSSVPLTAETQAVIPPAPEVVENAVGNEVNLAEQNGEVLVTPEKKDEEDNEELDDYLTSPTQLYVPPNQVEERSHTVLTIPLASSDESGSVNPAEADTLPIEDLEAIGNKLLSSQDSDSSSTDDESAKLKNSMQDVLKSNLLKSTPKKRAKESMQDEAEPSTSKVAETPTSKRAVRCTVRNGSPKDVKKKASPKAADSLFPAQVVLNANLIQSPKTYSRVGRLQSSLSDTNSESESQGSSSLIRATRRRVKITPLRHSSSQDKVVKSSSDSETSQTIANNTANNGDGRLTGALLNEEVSSNNTDSRSDHAYGRGVAGRRGRGRPKTVSDSSVDDASHEAVVKIVTAAPVRPRTGRSATPKVVSNEVKTTRATTPKPLKALTPKPSKATPPGPKTPRATSREPRAAKILPPVPKTPKAKPVVAKTATEKLPVVNSHPTDGTRQTRAAATAEQSPAPLTKRLSGRLNSANKDEESILSSGSKLNSPALKPIGLRKPVKGKVVQPTLTDSVVSEPGSGSTVIEKITKTSARGHTRNSESQQSSTTEDGLDLTAVVNEKVSQNVTRGRKVSTTSSARQTPPIVTEETKKTSTRTRSRTVNSNSQKSSTTDDSEDVSKIRENVVKGKKKSQSAEEALTVNASTSPRHNATRVSADAGRKKVAEWTSQGKRKMAAVDSPTAITKESASSVDVTRIGDKKTATNIGRRGRTIKVDDKVVIDKSSPGEVTPAKSKKVVVSPPVEPEPSKEVVDEHSPPKRKRGRPSKKEQANEIPSNEVVATSETASETTVKTERFTRLGKRKVPEVTQEEGTGKIVASKSPAKRNKLATTEVATPRRTGQRSDNIRKPKDVGGFSPSPTKGKRKLPAESPRMSNEETDADLEDDDDDFVVSKRSRGAGTFAQSSPIKRPTSTNVTPSKRIGTSTNVTPSKRIVTSTNVTPSKQIGNSTNATPSKRIGRQGFVSPATPSTVSTPKQRGSASANSSSSAATTPKTIIKAKDFKTPKPKIMFTGLTNTKKDEKTIQNLGGQVIDSVSDCSHLVTDKVRRTCKFLCSVSMGIPIVSVKWLKKCREVKSFIDPQSFLIDDEDMEQQHCFKLTESLARALKRPFLEGFEVHVTPKVVPDPEQMQPMIECAGGKFLPRMPTKKKSNETVVVVSCEDDRKCWTQAIKASIPIVSSEFILTGALRQKVELELFRLDVSDEAPPAVVSVSPSTKLSKTKVTKTAGRPRTRR